jgi:hypothetical protein
MKCEYKKITREKNMNLLFISFWLFVIHNLKKIIQVN